MGNQDILSDSLEPSTPDKVKYVYLDEDGDPLSKYETPSGWQKDYHTYIKPENAGNPNFMLCVNSPTDELFPQQAEPAIRMNHMDQLFEQLVDFEKDAPMQQTEAIMTPLLLHQQMALNWMTKRENNTEMAPFWQDKNGSYYNQATMKWEVEKPKCIRGGILADDMGLGKTLLTISLILGNHIKQQPMFAQSKKKRASTGSSATPQQGGDDSDCVMLADNDPLLLKRRRSDETGECNRLRFKKMKEGYIKPSKVKSKDLKQPGFQFRQIYLNELKKKDKKRRSSKSKKNIKTENQSTSKDIQEIFSDSDDDTELKKIKNHIDSVTRSPLLQDKPSQRLQTSGEVKSTLIICPMSVLSNWTGQFEQHVDPGIDLKLYLYYGANRVKDDKYIRQQDIVLTTYSTLSSDYRQEHSPLHKIKWLRIVLDEGHVIRNERSSQSVATIMLEAKRRWVLTGTPIQNRMSDLWTVFKFLRFEPFTDKQWWNRVVLSPTRSSDPNTYNRLQRLVQHVCIRRLKTDLINGKAIVELPEKRVVVEEIALEGEQKAQYEAMQTRGKTTLVRFLRMGEKYVLKHYASILVIIMRLRQLCCHPRLCRSSIKQMEQAIDIMGQLGKKWQDQNGAQQNNTEDAQDANKDPDGDEQKLIQQLLQVLAAGDSEECSICLDNLTNAVITRCAHVFCHGCITDVIDSSGLEVLCPLCRGEISKEQLVKVPEKPAEEEPIILSEEEQNWKSSAKIDALMESLVEMRSKDASVKCLVVSQFTSFLNLIQIPLGRAGFNYTRLDGRMSQQQRVESIDAFMDSADDSPTIMLLSLNAGGVGLTLTSATRVFLMDPAWNPAAEDQCFNRCHRLGQTKDVLVTKYVIKDSIEERMLELQEKKKMLVECAFGKTIGPQRNYEQRTRDRLDELRALIGI
eukprot:gene9927-10945_t